MFSVFIEKKSFCSTLQSENILRFILIVFTCFLRWLQMKKSLETNNETVVSNKYKLCCACQKYFDVDLWMIYSRATVSKFKSLVKKVSFPDPHRQNQPSNTKYSQKLEKFIFSFWLAKFIVILQKKTNLTIISDLIFNGSKVMELVWELVLTQARGIRHGEHVDWKFELWNRLKFYKNSYRLSNFHKFDFQPLKG